MKHEKKIYTAETLRREYKAETGCDACEMKDNINVYLYSDDYVSWLENRFATKLNKEND